MTKQSLRSINTKSAVPPIKIATPHELLGPEPILLAVTGMSPAILTETVWALAQEKPAIIPKRIIVLTTTQGRQKILHSLFSPLPLFKDQTAWEALRSALAKAGNDLEGRLQFGTTHDDIRVLTTLNRTTGATVEMDDIRTPAENEAAANFLLEQVRAIVENEDEQLIASMAGGRKTMGALLYACMNLVARETDRLTHVLVNDPFDNLPDFFFPGQPGSKLTDRSGKTVLTSKARIELADVPFVPLRNLFLRQLNRKAGTFTRLVESCRENIRQQAADRVKLTIETRRPQIEVNGTMVSLAPREHLLVYFLASRAKENKPPLPSYKDASSLVEEFRKQVLQDAPQNDLSDWRQSVGMQSKLDDEQEIRRSLSNIKKKLMNAGGDAMYLVHCLPQKGRCSLDVSGPLIFIKE